MIREIPHLDRLGIAERIKLVQDLWDEIAAHPTEVPLSDAQRAELDRRLQEHRTSPDDCVDWNAVKARIKG